jgi:hypothetical protein
MRIAKLRGPILVPLAFLLLFVNTPTSGARAKFVTTRAGSSWRPTGGRSS